MVFVINHTLLFSGEDDLVDVTEEVSDVAAKWRSLGLALRLKTAELDAISSKNHTDPTDCLRDMLPPRSCPLHAIPFLHNKLVCVMISCAHWPHSAKHYTLYNLLTHPYASI